MTQTNITVNADLTKPATTFVERMADFIGGAFQPYQIVRVAKAEAKRSLIEAQSEIEVTELQGRALQRLAVEEARKQKNMEAIVEKAVPLLEDKSLPDKMDDEWIANFFDKCRNVSDEQMQALWSRVLAGEANSPGSFSKRTVSLINTLEKAEAEEFGRACDFGFWHVEWVLAIIDPNLPMYVSRGLTFEKINNLCAAGLMTFSIGYTRTLATPATLFFGRTPINLEFPNGIKESLEIGSVLLTNAGRELVRLCKTSFIEEHAEYVLRYWSGRHFAILSTPWPREYWPEPPTGIS